MLPRPPPSPSASRSLPKPPATPRALLAGHRAHLVLAGPAPPLFKPSGESTIFGGKLIFFFFSREGETKSFGGIRPVTAGASRCLPEPLCTWTPTGPALPKAQAANGSASKKSG